MRVLWNIFKLKYGNASARKSAARMLGTLRDAQAVKPLLAALKDSNYYVRCETVEALGKIRDSQAVESLIRALTVNPWGEMTFHCSVIEALGEIGGEQAAKAIVAELCSHDSTVRECAFRTLGMMKGSVRGVEALVERLSYPGSTDRKMAADALERHGWQPDGDVQRAIFAIACGQYDTAASVGAAAVAPLIEELTDKYNWAVAQGALLKIGQAAVEPLVARLNNSCKSYERRRLVEVLAKLSDPRITEILHSILNDHSADVRDAAGEALGELGDLRTVTYFIHARTKSEDFWRKNFGKIIERIGAERAVPPLLEALKDGDALVRRRAAGWLGSIGDVRAAVGLIAALADSDSSVRDAAKWALTNITDFCELEPLVAALKDDAGPVRCWAAKWLGKINDPLAVNALVCALEDEKMSVRGGAAEALVQLGWLPNNARLRVNYAIARQEFDDVVKEGAVAVEPLIALLENKEPAMDCRAIGALAKLGDPRAVEPLIAMLTHYDSKVRCAVLQALGILRDARAVPRLWNALRGKEDRELRLSAHGDSHFNMLKEQQTAERRLAFESILKIGEFAVDFLIAKLDEYSTRPLVRVPNQFLSDFLTAKGHEDAMRSYAIDALAKIKDRRALRPLIAALNPAGVTAARALVQLEDPRALMPLLAWESRYANAENMSGFLLNLLRKSAVNATVQELETLMTVTDGHYHMQESNDRGCLITSTRVGIDNSEIRQLARQELVRRGIKA